MKEFKIRITLNGALAPSHSAKITITDDLIILYDLKRTENYPKSMFSLDNVIESLRASYKNMNATLNLDDIAKIKAYYNK